MIARTIRFPVSGARPAAHFCLSCPFLKTATEKDRPCKSTNSRADKIGCSQNRNEFDNQSGNHARFSKPQLKRIDHVKAQAAERAERVACKAEMSSAIKAATMPVFRNRNRKGIEQRE
ncbi:hypothetical protein [Heyndrickxia faecalis]|uniref:hypothetical protein n=1 Tax=Heyndrickxia faecalis TaxID=2824910 RepID=UPI0032B1F1D6